MSISAEPEGGGTMRYERKFLLEGATRDWVLAWIKVHPAAFRVRYPPRHVNSLYLDTLGRRSLWDTVEGVPNRQKTRIRWYGQLFGTVMSPQLEVKVKRGPLGRKLSWPLAPFAIQPGFQRAQLARCLADSTLPGILRLELLTLDMALLNRYQRRYYESSRSGCRLTLDTDLESYRVSPLANSFMARERKPDTVIIELKYAAASEDDIRQVLGSLPVRVTKSSKFAIGLEALEW